MQDNDDARLELVDSHPEENLRGKVDPPETNGIIKASTLVPFVSLLTVSSTFNLLFKVLFTFPSLYFFAIGLPEVFSFG